MLNKETEALRQVGLESSKTHLAKLRSGFYDHYMSGIGLDIGYAGHTSGRLPILSTALGVDQDYPGYDGTHLPFGPETQDYVYSSHCLEHIENWDLALREWYRVLKTGGFLIIAVPHRDLYEKKRTRPSRWNADHKFYYTPGNLLAQIEAVLPVNGYRLRLCEDGDAGFDYEKGPEEHSTGQYEITCVIEKIKQPTWGVI